jgi:methenyltetrahydromethanopterin cyclohydrolase
MAVGVLSLNDRAKRVADALAAEADALGAAVHAVQGARVIDCGVDARGSLAAGLYVARACMADLGSASLVTATVGEVTLPAVAVEVHQPVAACLASQYAGWQISVDNYFAMGSGPMRALYGKEELYDEIGLREKTHAAVGILESSALPGPDVVATIAGKLHIAPTNLTLLVARTASLAGGVQVVARSVETALHKLHALGFDVKRVVGGFGVAPLPPVAKNDLRAIGRTNDAILYGGRITLFCTGDDESLADVGPRLPSSASKDYGVTFRELFERYDRDFYRIDPLLFSPATICLQNIQTGKSQTFGQVNDAVLVQSFFE